MENHGQKLVDSITKNTGLSEKHTKFEKIFLMVLTNQLIYLVNVKTRGRFFQTMCASQKVRTLHLCLHFTIKLQYYN